MGFFDDFAQTPLGQRLLQHVGSEVAPFAALPQQSNPILRSLQGVAAGATALPKAVLDTVGLGLEGTANVTKGGLGAALILADQHGVPLPGISPHDKALLDALAQTYQGNQGGGGNFMQAYQDAINTVDQLRAHGGTPLAWGLGGASMALDPSNLLPVGKVGDVLSGVVKPVGKAALGAVRAEAPAVLAKVGPEVAPVAEQAAARLAPQVAALPPEVATKIEAAVAGHPVPVVKKLTGTVAPQTEKYAPAVRAAIEADPRVQELRQTIADIKASVDPTATQISGQTGGTVKKLGSRLRGPQMRLNQLEKDIAAQQATQDVTRLAPDVAPQAGPLKTIFGEDASVVHSGTYPGNPQAAGAGSRLTPDITPVVDNTAPASAQEAAALAPDATINDKLNALEQNPNLPVQTGTPQSVNDLTAALKSAYGDNTFARKNAIPKLTNQLGVRLQSDGTFVKNGVDVTAPILDYLNGRGAMGNDRKAINAALDYTKGVVDDLAGGGGGLPGAAPIRLATTLGGAAVGAGAGYQQDGVGGALKGAALGGLGGAGLGSVPYGTLGDLAQIGNTAGKAGMADALQNGKFDIKALPSIWTGDKSKTFRGLGLDTMTNYVRALINKIPLSEIRAARADLIQQAKATGSTYNAGHPYTSMTADMFKTLGQDITKYDLHQAYGQGYLGGADKFKNAVHPGMSALATAGFSLANPATYLTGGLGVGAAAVRGAARPYTDAAFNAINDLEHNAARDAGFRAAIKDQLGQVAPAFLDQIKAAGGDIKGLAADGMFSPKQAEAALPGAGATWQAVLDQVLGTPKVEAVKANAKKGIQAVEAADQQDGLASQFVKQAFGDYTDRNAAAKALSAVAPFSRYTLGQLPVAATLVAGHPGATLLVAKMLRDANQRAAQTGTPSYNADNLDIPSGTPVVGGLASLLASAPAQGSINLLNSFSPVNIDVGSLGDITDPTKSPYQKASALMNAVGLQFNPLIQAGTYVIGANDQAPGAQSRYAGLENALGGPQVPTIKTALDNVRKAVSGQYPDSYDPVQGYIAEEVLRTTHLPISDPSNRQAAIDAQDPTSQLYQQAKAAVDRGAAAKNLLSVISPVTLTTTTDVKAQYRQAKAQDPRYTKEQIAQAAAVNPTIASQMEAVNAQIAAQDPALVAYTQPKLTADEKADPRVKAFAEQNASIKAVAPKIYAQMLADYKRQLGIK